MEENNNTNNNVEELEIPDSNLLEIIKKAGAQEKLSQDEVNKLLKDAKERIDFVKLIDEIKIPSDKYVIYTDGDEQLVYENGEFFLQSSTDSTKIKKKKKRLEAKDMYIEYFIKYTINPIIERKNMIEQKRQMIELQGKEKSVNEKAKKEIEVKER